MKTGDTDDCSGDVLSSLWRASINSSVPDSLKGIPASSNSLCVRQSITPNPTLPLDVNKTKKEKKSNAWFILFILQSKQEMISALFRDSAALNASLLPLQLPLKVRSKGSVDALTGADRGRQLGPPVVIICGSNYTLLSTEFNASS